MILLIVGVKEGVEIAERLIEEGYTLTIATRTKFCTAIVQKCSLEKYMIKCENDEVLFSLLEDSNIELIVDASSETKTEVSNFVKKLDKKPIYIRYVREEIDIPPEPLINTVYSFEEAAALIANLSAKNIFITTGSHNLNMFFSNHRLAKKRMIVRVLPDWKVIKKCQDLGLDSKNIVAMQGPFSKRINKAIFKMYNADLIVTRDSGITGGADTKISAAVELKIPIIVIKRQVSKDYITAVGIEEAVQIIKKYQGGQNS